MRLTAPALLALLPLAFSQGAAASEWRLDPDHTEIGFSVRHLMVSDVRGAFDKYQGVIKVDDKDPTKSSIDVEIEVASINTKSKKRDDHLRNSDFFDAPKFPKMFFKSTKIEKTEVANAFKVTGDLTMRGVTKPVVLDVKVSDEWKDPWAGQSHRGVTATGKILRQDFGMTWQSKMDRGGVVVGDEVQLMISTELIKVR